MRRAAALVMVVLTAVLLAGAAIAWYADTTLVDDEEFATRVTSSLGDDDVRRVVADQIVTGLTSSAVPNALVVRPLLVPLVSVVADTPVFRRVVHRALASRHRALVQGDTTFSFGLPLGEGTLFEGIRRVAPTVARRIPEDLSVPVLRLDPKGFELTAAHALVTLARWRWPLVAAALVAALGAALLAGGLRGALVHVGLAIAGGGLLVAAVVAGLGEFVAAHAAHAANLDEDAERDAIRAVWSTLFGDLRSAALIAALAGALLAAIASVALPAVDPGAGWRWVRGAALSSSRTARTLRAAVLIAAGAAIVFEPALLGRIAVAAGGVLVVILGLAQLSGTPEPREEAVAAVAGGSRPRPRPWAPAAAVVLVVVATGLAMAIVLPGPRIAPVAVAGEPGGCNGLRAMCDRRLDQVVLAGTHNSYAAADEPGWLFANQRFGIERQLRDGIRALLIDVHLGAPDPRSGRVRTDLEAEGSDRNKVARELSPAALRTADRLVGRAGVGRPTGPRRPYLCHTLCELGAEPLDEQLTIIRRFLTDNPREVVVLFVEPYIPVATIERSLRETDLLSKAPVIGPGEPLPTLGALIAADTRLVVLAEQDGGERPWYLDGFRFVQDTPLGATRPSQLSCDRFRGEPDSPLLMLNHWIPPFPPSVTRNQAIGGAFLRARIGRCERQREMLPNLLAVDFYERTGVVGIARDLNAEQP
jgi:hypothetical protein